ncbi:IS110 family RNA-guided transposase [Catenuloplanes japonicus]|uniref:IS110 family transposase n=1 Tax=Catenuloplanes japonicus TaxID=33876 RepID=UPI0005254ACE|nr:IS110 family transposase [Catenuloplanes japonicus]
MSQSGVVVTGVEVTGGVDTHRDTHTVAAVDGAGRMLGHAQFEASAAGYVLLLGWLRARGSVVLVGVEGTGAYGAGLARYLRAEGVRLVEVDRPDRKTRRGLGKSDPVDAEAAARAALAQRRTGVPKERDGRVEALRNLRVARRGAVVCRADVQRQMKALIVTAAEPVRQALRGLRVPALVKECAAAVPDRDRCGEPGVAVMIALGSLARRHQQLSAEIAELDELITPLVTAINPRLIAAFGVGPDVAAQLLITAGDNPGRLRSEAAFAMLCGVAPLPASSGRTHRHRLNRGGDRDANNALWWIAITRMGRDPRTRAYVEKRTKDGLSKPEILRCLKRYIARDIYTLLMPPKNLENTPGQT